MAMTNSIRDKALDYIEEKAKSIGLVTNREEGSLSIWATPASGISIIISCNENKDISFYYHQRTNSWTYNGERTDLHDIISLIFAIFLKEIGLCSVFLTDVYNPITDADTEIYSRYLTPIQLNHKFMNKTYEEYHMYLDLLVYSLLLFEKHFWSCFPGCPCDSCKKRLGYEYLYTSDIPKGKLNHIMQSVHSVEENITYNERKLPNWLYYRDFKKQISVVQSEYIISFLGDIIKNDQTQSVDAINGRIFIDGDFNYFLSSNRYRNLKVLLSRLGDKLKQIILLENIAVAIGKEYMIFINYDCGIYRHQVEKNKLKIRHEKEFQILFKPYKLQWSEHIEDCRFEELIKDLLEREANILRVRKTSHTRERDGGVDLIADWQVPKKVMTTKDGNNPHTTLKIIVQCKAYNNGVSKSQVLDIRDTIEDRNYDGYFLAVSSYLRKSLTDHLDKMRISDKYWVDWWGRDEITNSR